MTTSNENVWHTVGNMQHLKTFAGLSPRSLCGLKLKQRPGAKYPTDDAPQCPECAAKAS
jgi:hypothetical protein